MIRKNPAKTLEHHIGNIIWAKIFFIMLILVFETFGSQINVKVCHLGKINVVKDYKRTFPTELIATFNLNAP